MKFLVFVNLGLFFFVSDCPVIKKLKVWVELLSKGLLELQKRTSSELSRH